MWAMLLLLLINSRRWDAALANSRAARKCCRVDEIALADGTNQQPFEEIREQHLHALLQDCKAKREREKRKDAKDNG